MGYESRFQSPPTFRFRVMGHALFSDPRLWPKTGKYTFSAGKSWSKSEISDTPKLPRFLCGKVVSGLFWNTMYNFCRWRNAILGHFCATRWPNEKSCDRLTDSILMSIYILFKFLTPGIVSSNFQTAKMQLNSILCHFWATRWPKMIKLAYIY